MNIIEMRRKEDEYYGKIEAEYGENWPEVLLEVDLTGIGETNFNTELSNQVERSFKPSLGSER